MAFRAGDVILSVDGQAVKDSEEVQDAVASSSVGQNLPHELFAAACQDQTLTVRPGTITGSVMYLPVPPLWRHPVAPDRAQLSRCAFFFVSV